MKDDEPAFPTQRYLRQCNKCGEGYIEGHNGMTLRDYFAARAIRIWMKESDIDEKYIAKRAYRLANAMLQERNKK